MKFTGSRRVKKAKNLVFSVKCLLIFLSAKLIRGIPISLAGRNLSGEFQRCPGNSCPVNSNPSVINCPIIHSTYMTLVARMATAASNLIMSVPQFPVVLTFHNSPRPTLKVPLPKLAQSQSPLMLT